MKYMCKKPHNQTATNTNSNKKKKLFTNKFSQQQRRSSKPSPLQKLFESTTILSRSPSHSFNPRKMFMSSQSSYNQSHQAGHQSFANSRFNPAANLTNHKSNSFKNYRNFKNKSKSIKTANNKNKNYKNSNQPQQSFSFPYYQQKSQQQQQQVLNDAATHLANILYSELTINLTKDEPRLVVFNNTNSSKQQNHHHQHQQQQQQISNASFHNKTNTFQQSRQNVGLKNIKNSNSHTQSIQPSNGAFYSNASSAPVAINQRYTSRFKYVKPAPVFNHAPYNTTQYIMHDYSKRRSGLDQECPNEQQQFSDDWNMALANTHNNSNNNNNNNNNNSIITEANNINNTLINTNAFVSLLSLSYNRDGAEEEAGESVASLSGHSAHQQLSSSL